MRGGARFWSVGPAFWIYATNFTGVGSKLVIFIISNIFIITHLLAKSGGSEPRPSKTHVDNALKQGLGISHICWQNLAEVSRRQQKTCKYRIKQRARDFTQLLVKSGGSEPSPSRKPVNTASNEGLGISHSCWKNLAEVSRDRAKRL